jgi:O-antigen/teichoic acid export membrane protein
MVLACTALLCTLRELGPSALVYAGNLARTALGFLMTLLVARLLGPEQFGLFSLFIVVMILCHNLAGEGLDPGVVRYYALYLHSNPVRASRVLGAALAVRLAVGFALALAVWFAAGWMAVVWLSSPSAAGILRLGAIGAVIAAVTNFMLAVLQAREQFVAYALLTPLTNLLRIASVPLLVTFGAFTLYSVTTLHGVCFLMSALVGVILLRRPLRAARFNCAALRELLGFSAWTWLASLSFLVQVHLAIPVLNRYAGAAQAGVYAAGLSLLLVADQLTAAVLTVRAPKVSRLTDRAAMRRYVQNGMPALLLLALPPAIGILVADPMVRLIYGTDYAPAGAVLRVLLFGSLATLVTHPLYLVFYAMSRPSLYAASAVVSLVAWAVCAMLLIPHNGALGAAWASTAARLLQGALIVLLLIASIGPFWRTVAPQESTR